jgi:hypothetical protein
MVYSIVSVCGTFENGMRQNARIFSSESYASRMRPIAKCPHSQTLLWRCCKMSAYACRMPHTHIPHTETIVYGPNNILNWGCFIFLECYLSHGIRLSIVMMNSFSVPHPPAIVGHQRPGPLEAMSRCVVLPSPKTLLCIPSPVALTIAVRNSSDHPDNCCAYHN